MNGPHISWKASVSRPPHDLAPETGGSQYFISVMLMLGEGVFETIYLLFNELFSGKQFGFSGTECLFQFVSNVFFQGCSIQAFIPLTLCIPENPKLVH